MMIISTNDTTSGVLMIHNTELENNWQFIQNSCTSWVSAELSSAAKMLSPFIKNLTELKTCDHDDFKHT